jgi:hypothetical protein
MAAQEPLKKIKVNFKDNEKILASASEPIGSGSGVIIGSGGGKQLVFAQGILDDPATFDGSGYTKADYIPILDQMLQHFKSKYPQGEIKTKWMEHRVYLMNGEVFEGDVHDDCSEYTVIYYYRIDPGIIGGSLDLINKDGKVITTLEPKEGDMKIFCGDHQVKTLTGHGVRGIITLMINGHP